MAGKAKIYFDNAATTPLHPDVLEAMLPYLSEHFGNPSSIHGAGRITKTAVEKARKTIAELLNTSPSEIIFTSGATEADNMALMAGTAGSGIRHLITSPIEHHAVLHTAQALHKADKAQLHLLSVNNRGEISLDELQTLLASLDAPALVSLMHGNNEIGNLNPIEKIAEICSTHQSLFHSDTVQTIGTSAFDLEKIGLHYAVASAHKFHGPKGVGFLYANAENTPLPLIYGGAQERNLRGGTENVAGIVGMAKALELAQLNRKHTTAHLAALKQYTITQIKNNLPYIRFNGCCDDPVLSMPSVLSLSLPESDINDMLLFNLDIAGIYVSGGSACTSGANISSHVLEALHHPAQRGVIRVSFGKNNTTEEVDVLIALLKKLYEE